MSTKSGSTDDRTAAFSRNVQLESLLRDINSTLWVSEQKLLGNPQALQYPLVLIMGPMRSGTTLFMQWLANTGLFSYPTNLLSRFYQAPVIGAMIQLLLTDPRYNFRDELGEFVQQAEYKSENGKTKGVLAPNEFWYFWRRFFSDPERDIWTDEQLRESMDTRTMRAELAGMMGIFQKPFVAKGILFNYNIPFLASTFDNALFVQIKRDPVTNVASVLDARRRQYGNERRWYSFKIPEYEELRGLDAITQVAGQVHYVDKAVTKGLEGLDESRKLVVRYEEFCTNPRDMFYKIINKTGLDGEIYRGPTQFTLSRNIRGADSIPISKALKYYSGNI